MSDAMTFWVRKASWVILLGECCGGCPSSRHVWEGALFGAVRCASSSQWAWQLCGEGMGGRPEVEVAD